MLTPDHASAVQRVVLLEYLKTGNTFSRLLDLGLALIFWPWKSLNSAWKMTRLHGHKVSQFRSRPVQFAQQIWFAWGHGVSPQMYYQMGMVMAPSPMRPMEWMQNGHASLLSRAFRVEKSLPEINDKLLFARTMQRNEVATPEILAVFADGEQLGEVEASGFLQVLERGHDFYVKPRKGSVGRDQVLVSRTEEGAWRCIPSSYKSRSFRRIIAQYDRRRLDAKGVLGLLCQLSTACPLIVQPRLVNHGELPDLGGPALQAIRLLTGRRGDEIVILRAQIRLPFQNQIASQWGVDSEVDLETGCLGQTFEDYPDPSFSNRFSSEGPVILGLTVPCWIEAKNLVKRAHFALADYSFLGWDVAITPTGPVVIEANGNFGFSSLQKPGPSPIIDENFLSVFDYWANRPKAELS